MLDLYHPDYTRVFHAKEFEQGLDDLKPIMSPWLIGTNRNKIKCLYEIEHIMVEHFVGEFQDGTTEAVSSLKVLKDGLVWRTETESTTVIKNRLTHKTLVFTIMF